MEVCTVCGTFLPPLSTLNRRHGGSFHTMKCNVCEDGGKMEEIMVPSVYKYLIAELGSVNLRICLKSTTI
jgi:DNA-directed RNA polymerase beta subunit